MWTAESRKRVDDFRCRSNKIAKLPSSTQHWSNYSNHTSCSVDILTTWATVAARYFLAAEIHPSYVFLIRSWRL